MAGVCDPDNCDPVPCRQPLFVGPDRILPASAALSSSHVVVGFAAPAARAGKRPRINWRRTARNQIVMSRHLDHWELTWHGQMRLCEVGLQCSKNATVLTG